MFKKQKAVFDGDNHRFIISPLTNDATISVQRALRVIKNSTTFSNSTTPVKISWKRLTEFTGSRNTSDCFKVCYTANKQHELVERLQPYLVIDVDNNKAYFYDYEHKPDSALSVHIPVTIKNNEPNSQILSTLVPTKILGRISLSDPLDRMLMMTLTPTNGYLLGIKDITISKPGMSYTISGHKKNLNDLLKKIHFVGTNTGTGSVTVKINDGEGDIGSIVSTTVTFTLIEGSSPSVPAVNLPEEQEVVLNEVSEFDPITVADADNKFIELRISPFGCNLQGFYGYIFTLVPGQVRTIYGTPAVINRDLAHVKVIALQENAQIGVELICGNTHIRDYMKFTVVEEKEENGGGNGGATPTPPPAKTFDVEVIFAENAYEVTANTATTITGPTFSSDTNYDKSFKTKITTSAGVGVTVGGETIGSAESETSDSYTFTGTLSETNTFFSSLSVTASVAGTISIEFVDEDSTESASTNITIAAATPGE